MDLYYYVLNVTFLDFFLELYLLSSKVLKFLFVWYALTFTEIML